jgi:P-type Mg2+ transporter
MTSALVEDGEHGRLLVTKGAPESVLALCKSVSDAAHATLDREFSAGSRVVAIATRPAPGLATITPADERDLELAGYLAFLSPPKADVAAPPPMCLPVPAFRDSGSGVRGRAFGGSRAA